MKGIVIRIVAVAFWLAGLLLAAPQPSRAGVDIVDIVRKDLASVSGYVVMPVNGQYLVDLDARNGLRVGDLLAVVKPGRKIVHPVSKKVLGTLDEVTAVLRVTRVKSGYSYAEPLDAAGAIDKGAVVRRFSDLSAAFLGGTPAFYDRLRSALPDLEWQGRFAAAAEAPRVDLLFAVVDGRLNLLDSRGGKVRSYALNLPAADRPARSAAAVPAPSPPVAVAAPAPPEPAAKTEGPASSGVNYGGFVNLGAIGGRVQMAAFIRADGRLLMAALEGERLKIFQVDAGLKLLAEQQLDGGATQPLTVRWWRPRVDGPLYLAVSAAMEIDRNYGNEVETRLAGSVLEWRDGRLVPRVRNLRWFMGSFDRDGDGLPETLLGQGFDLDATFGRVVALHWSDDGRKLVGAPVAFELPPDFVVPGSMMADLNGDGQVETVMVRNGYLGIYAGKERLYQSSGQMGGSLASLTYDVNPGSVDLMHRTVGFEVPPVAADIDDDGVPELLALAAEGSSFKAPGLNPGIEKSWIAVVKYRNGMFDKGRLPGDRENPLQGLWADREQVLLVESRTTSFWDRKGKSYLLRLELKR